jgi:gluconolactonase
LRVDPFDGTVDVVAETGAFLLGIAFDGDGACYACDMSGRILRVDPRGPVDVFAEAVEGRRLRTPNFPAFTSDGTLWFSDSGSAWNADDGALIRVPRASDPELASDEPRLFPNGIAIPSDESSLYLVESRRPGIVKFELVDGVLGQMTEALRMHHVVPDGLAFAADGTLYISCWRPDRVYLWREGASSEVFLDDPTAEYLNTPTNLCFGGDDFRRLYFASLGGWTITQIDVPHVGQRLAHPSFS